MSITPIYGSTYPTATPGALGGSVAQAVTAGLLEVLITIASTIDGEINAWVLGYVDADCGWQPMEMLTCNKRDSPKLAGHNGFKNIVVPTDRHVLIYFPEARAADVMGACINAYAATAAGGLAVGGVLTGFLPNVGLVDTAVTPDPYPLTGQIPTFTVDQDGRLTAAGSTTDGSAITSLPGLTLSNSGISFAAGAGIAGNLSTADCDLPRGILTWLGAAGKSGTLTADAALNLRSTNDTVAIQGVQVTLNATATGMILDAPGAIIQVGHGTTTEIRVGYNASEPIALYGQAGVAQHSTTGTTTGFTTGAGTAMKSDSTSTGGTGTKAYTFGDLVLALKNLGAIASS